MANPSKNLSWLDRIANSSLGKLFTGATLKAAMADNPAVMLASGFRIDENNNIVQDQVDSPGARLLRDGLALTSTMAAFPTVWGALPWWGRMAGNGYFLVNGGKGVYDTTANVIKNGEVTSNDVNNYALSLLEMMPAVTASYNTKNISRNLASTFGSENLRRRAYHLIEPFGYNMENFRTVLGSYFKHPSWIRTKNIPTTPYIQSNSDNVSLLADDAQRTMAFAKAMRITPNKWLMKNAPYVYKENPNGTWRFEKNPEFTGDKIIYDSDKLYIKGIVLNRTTPSVLMDPFPGRPGGLTWYEPSTTTMRDKWDLLPFEYFEWLPEGIRNLDFVEAMGGDPFVFELNLGAMVSSEPVFTHEPVNMDALINNAALINKASRSIYNGNSLGHSAINQLNNILSNTPPYSINLRNLIKPHIKYDH